VTDATIDHVVSYCRVCPALCGIVVEVDRETSRVLRIRGDRDHHLSRGYTCVKGRALPEELYAPDRLRGALRRANDGSFRVIGTAHAVTEIAERLRRIVDEHGPRAVALYVGTRGYEVLQLAGARAWLRGIGSPSFYSTYTIDQPGKDLARARHGSWPAGFQDVSTSDVVMLVGTNPVVSCVTPYIGMPATNIPAELRRLRRRGLRVIVVDPRRTETAAHADVHLRPRPGTDSALLAAMICVILADGTYDHEFVARFARGLESLRSIVAPFTPEFAESLTGVPADDLVTAARLFAVGPRGCAVGGTGINMSPHPTLNEYLLLCLNTMCGRYRRAGEPVSNPGVLTPGRSVVEGPRSPRVITGRGVAQPRVRGLRTLYDQMPSAALADEILEPGEGQVRALVVSGGNPAVALPDTQKTRRALASLELLVTLDVRMAQTARISDYVIGCPTSLEKADATLASDLRFPVPFAQYTDRVVDPAPDILEEWDFFRRLAATMGTPWELNDRVGLPIPIDVDASGVGADPTSPELWASLCAAGRLQFSELRSNPHGLLVDVPAQRISAAATPVSPDDRLELADAVMLDELRLVAATPGEMLAESAWPLRLTSRRMHEYYNSWGQDVPAVRARFGANPAFVHPADLEQFQLHDGEQARLESRHGAVDVVVRAADDVARGTVSIAHCWGDAHAEQGAAATGSEVNLLVSNDHDVSDEVGMARQSALPVRLVRKARTTDRGQ
jgi:anaerobic selenocysteine-containing dehydrogenase